MSVGLNLSTDAFAGNRYDFDLAADYLELKAFFSPDNQALSQDITDALELAAEMDYEGVDEELKERGEAASGAVGRISERCRVLADTYPFEVDEEGEVINFQSDDLSFGQAAYLISLVLSHLKSVSDVLYGTPVYPSSDEERNLRKYFQYFATAALAAEVGGPAWSFGFPRPDRTGFIEKLTEIWSVLKDGRVCVNPTAPTQPKDDQIDVFAWREQQDGLPGFLLAAAQVATGANWKNKSIKAHIAGVFTNRWFQPQPVTTFVAYHIIPFARTDLEFQDDVRVLGNILHRLRLPIRVMEANALSKRGVMIEAFDELKNVVDWLKSYEQRASIV